MGLQTARQIRETAVCVRPTSAAIGRADQCVASLGVVSKVVTISSLILGMQIAAELGVSRPMATEWRSRFAVDRLDALVGAPRSGHPRAINDVLLPGR